MNVANLGPSVISTPPSQLLLSSSLPTIPSEAAASYSLPKHDPPQAAMNDPYPKQPFFVLPVSAILKSSTHMDLVESRDTEYYAAMQENLHGDATHVRYNPIEERLTESHHEKSIPLWDPIMGDAGSIWGSPELTVETLEFQHGTSERDSRRHIVDELFEVTGVETPDWWRGLCWIL
ncbi:uncharacterized protein BO97DRAFT_402797 [Aspergillus homomorphus CBS 101889]|uniref:Uncharacterized protein n=1 Tax=Aspergillus homomorphus (strain CBS 101889) TaxID=1450537 RepID=A0A395I8V0_ASPHC|nr:hypothetical protein BO97DRAFT_402797 [Aspergillus homomorphus CBS 101889]RAL16385.1 hypothetical protein BO97DRAFT_402797 [Aspergillus homomorphus CBS 101889]